MQRMLYLMLTLAVAIGKRRQRPDQRSANSKVQSMTGVVKTVSASSLTLTLELGGNEIGFGVDRSTRVLAKGRGQCSMIWSTGQEGVRSPTSSKPAIR